VISVFDPDLTDGCPFYRASDLNILIAISEFVVSSCRTVRVVCFTADQPPE